MSADNVIQFPTDRRFSELANEVVESVVELSSKGYRVHLMPNSQMGEHTLCAQCCPCGPTLFGDSPKLKGSVVVHSSRQEKEPFIWVAVLDTVYGKEPLSMEDHDPHCGES